MFDGKDCEEAERVAKRLDIKFHVVDFVKEIFGILLVNNTIQIYRLCNVIIVRMIFIILQFVPTGLILILILTAECSNMFFLVKCIGLSIILCRLEEGRLTLEV